MLLMEGYVSCLTVMVTNDEIIEGDETFTVNLMVNTPGVMGGVLNTVTTITDNEGIENSLLLFTQISVWL